MIRSVFSRLGSYSAITPICKYATQVETRNMPSFVMRIGARFGLMDTRYPYGKLTLSGHKLHAVCAEYPDVAEFSEKLSLPDTFETWYSISLIHLWLLFVRLRTEGIEGKLLRESIMKHQWNDLNSRMRAFMILRKKEAQVTHARVLLMGHMLAYDEGILLNSDTVLASAIWRNLFLASPDVKATHLEMMVDYIRKNIEHLQSIPADKLIGEGYLTFLPLGSSSYRESDLDRRYTYSTTYPSWG